MFAYYGIELLKFFLVLQISLIARVVFRVVFVEFEGDFAERMCEFALIVEACWAERVGLLVLYMRF